MSSVLRMERQKHSSDKSGRQTSNTENSDFYGINEGILVRDGAMLNLTGAEVNTSAQGGNGVFCYGSGTTLNISDATIRTTMDNSGGIETAGGGATNASNLDIETQGNSAAAIRSDRGGRHGQRGGWYLYHGRHRKPLYLLHSALRLPAWRQWLLMGKTPSSWRIVRWWAI